MKAGAPVTLTAGTYQLGFIMGTNDQDSALAAYRVEKVADVDDPGGPDRGVGSNSGGGGGSGGAFSLPGLLLLLAGAVIFATLLRRLSIVKNR